MSRFSAELCQRADSEVQTILGLNTEEAQILCEQNTWRHTEQRAEVTPIEHVQLRQMNATHQTASFTANCGYSDWQAQSLFKNNSIIIIIIIYLQWKKYASFAKLLNGKMKQQIVAVTAAQLCLHHCMILHKSLTFSRLTTYIYVVLHR